MENKLLPCPFCGGEAETLLYSNTVTPMPYRVACTNGDCVCCRNSTRFKTKKEAIVAWNRRADRWIPVTERLPEDGVEVLVWFEYFRYGDYNRLFQTTGISYTYKGNWSGFVNGESGWSKLRIIAWRPLPEPYREG